MPNNYYFSSNTLQNWLAIILFLWICVPQIQLQLQKLFFFLRLILTLFVYTESIKLLVHRKQCCQQEKGGDCLSTHYCLCTQNWWGRISSTAFSLGPLTAKKDSETLERVQRRATKLWGIWNMGLTQSGWENRDCSVCRRDCSGETLSPPGSKL